MSEKTKNRETQNANMVVFKPNKQKHNSKRRRSKKNKTIVELKDTSEISKVDEVVNYLCSTLEINDSETSLDLSFPAKVAKQSPKIVGVCTGQNHNRNSEFQEVEPLPSTKDLNNFFENLKIHASGNPIKSNNVTDFLNVDLLKKTKCGSLLVEDLENLKQEHLRKDSSLEEKTISNESLKKYFNLNMIPNSPGTSVLNQIDSSSMRLVSEIEENLHVNLCKANETPVRSECFQEYFNVDALMTEETNLVSSIKSTSKFLVKELGKTLLKHEKGPENGKKLKKTKAKKSENKKSDALDELEPSSCSPKIYFNSDLPKTSSDEPSSQDSAQPNKIKKKQHNSKLSPSKTETKFPKYLSSEELEALSNFGVLLSGIIRINQKNFKEAYINAPDKGMDILIEGVKDRNRALEGDEVYFVLKPKEHHRVSTDCTDVQKTAVVVGIKNLNHNRRAIGTLNPVTNKKSDFVLFSPRDSKLPRIRIKKKNFPRGFFENFACFKNKLYFAKISAWNDLRYAEGEIVKEVGVAGDLEVETEAILLNYGLDVTPYCGSLKVFLPPSNFKITESDVQKREDLRNDCVFTIDPQNAVDLDDAVSCKPLPNGNFEVGVHISDVSYFLEEGTLLDKAVSERATTVYLVQKTYHMLPSELCRLCSLTPGEDKFSFSVLWEFTPDCKIVSHRFARTVINSCAQLSYDQVQAIIDDLPFSDSGLPNICGGHTIKNIKDIILFLHKIAVGLRNKRFSSGALKIEQKKISFSLDENKLPINFKEEVHEPSHQLIEEFMLLANVTVAEKLNCSFPKLAFLRSHPPPLPHVLKKLQKTLEKYGMILNISSSGSIYSSLLKYSGKDTESIARMLVLNNALAKPMARAKYYCGGLFSEKIDRRHYALNVSLYTHFTSPIRRYADVMVHRLLAASLNYCDPPNWKTDYVQAIAANCNKQKYAAKMAQEMSVELYFAIFIELQGHMICKAVVCDIKDKSFDCIGLSTGIHQRIYFEHIKGEYKQEKENGILKLIVKWPKDETHEKESVQIIEIFSVVEIEIRRASVLKTEAKLRRLS